MSLVQFTFKNEPFSAGSLPSLFDLGHIPPCPSSQLAGRSVVNLKAEESSLSSSTTSLSSTTISTNEQRPNMVPVLPPLRTVLSQPIYPVPVSPRETIYRIAELQALHAQIYFANVRLSVAADEDTREIIIESLAREWREKLLRFNFA